MIKVIAQESSRSVYKCEETPKETKVKSTISIVAAAPFVVHVTRPKEIDIKRKELPIVMMEQEIMEAINENSSVIICGETGCGKTTQVPQYLYEAGFGSNESKDRKGIIGITQPRRVAVLATAKRVALELGVKVGKEVGYQVMHDLIVGKSCSIKFMTDGILLREIESDPWLHKYSIITLDEAHERSVNTDILIGMLSRVIQVRQVEYEKQQRLGDTISLKEKIYPLKLILMSATLRVEDFVSNNRIFSSPPPVTEVPTRQYDVKKYFPRQTEEVNYIGEAYTKVMEIHNWSPPDVILVFVTGIREVEYLCQQLRKASDEIVEKNSRRNQKHESFSVSVENSSEDFDMKRTNESIW